MLGAIDSITDVSTLSNNFLGKISEIKSAVDGKPAPKQEEQKKQTEAGTSSSIPASTKHKTKSSH